MENQVFVGIDVSKARLDVARRPGAESFSVTNNQRGIATLVKRLKTWREPHRARSQRRLRSRGGG